MTNETKPPETVSIRPVGDVSDVKPVDAIRAVRNGARLTLADAKLAVETMLSTGSAAIASGPYVAVLAHDSVFGHATGLADDLAACGIGLHVGDRTLAEYVRANFVLPGESDGPSVTIVPAGGLADVRTIEAIRVLRNTGTLGLKDAKARVESMIDDGVAELGLGRFAAMLSDPALADFAVEMRDGLAGAGVELRVDGLALDDYLGNPSTPGAAGP